MLKITVELVPFGWKTPKTIATAKIWNDGSGDNVTGNYGYELIGAGNKLMKKGEIKSFKRKRKHVWELIYLMLKDKYSLETP